MLPFSEYTSENSKKFRVNASSLFLTYARCDVKKEILLESLGAFFAKWIPKFILVSHEFHKDEGDHLHAVVVLTKELNFHRQDYLNSVLPGFHPHIQKCRNKSNCVNYTMKDGDFCHSGTFNPSDWSKAAKDKKSTVSTLITESILQDDSNLDQIIETYPGFALLHMKRITDMIAYREVKKIRRDLVPWVELPIHSFHNKYDIWIINWLNSAIKKTRPFRSKQLWVFGESSLGKSSMIDGLRKSLHCFFPSPDENFWDGISTTTDMIILDEFRGSKSVQVLNQLCEGRQMTLPIKGTSFNKDMNIPVMVLSNYPPHGCYEDSASRLDWNAFLNRWLVIDLNGNKIDPFSVYNIVQDVTTNPGCIPDAIPDATEIPDATKIFDASSPTFDGDFSFNDYSPIDIPFDINED